MCKFIQQNLSQVQQDLTYLGKPPKENDKKLRGSHIKVCWPPLIARTMCEVSCHFLWWHSLTQAYLLASNVILEVKMYNENVPLPFERAVKDTKIAL